MLPGITVLRTSLRIFLLRQIGASSHWREGGDSDTTRILRKHLTCVLFIAKNSVVLNDLEIFPKYDDDGVYLDCSC